MNATTSTEVGERVLDAATRAAAELFGPRLVAAYALGSLAHGGFNALVSDVDLALVFDGPLRADDEANVAKLKQSIVDSGMPLAERLSTFWGSKQAIGRPDSAGRFPPLDVLDLVLHGRLLAGRESRDGIPTPTHDELVIGGVRFALEVLRTQADIRALREPTLLYANGARRVTKRVLFPIRFLFTARTGRIGRVELAVEHYLELGQPACELVREAMGWRYELPEQDEQPLRLLSAHLVPLYAELLEDHIVRMEELHQPPLASALRKWGEELGIHQPP